MMATAFGPKKVLLLEFNEITRTIIDPMIAKGRLPHFQQLFHQGATAAPESVDAPPHLDPWVTWVTVHTGVDRSVHGATVLEQDSGTLHAKRTWDYAVDAGKSVGVFGSISAYPPRPVPGFMVPGPFAPSNRTYPAYVEPVQALNRKYTQVHHKNSQADSPLDMAKLGVELLRLGLSPITCARIAAQLVRERGGFGAVTPGHAQLAEAPDPGDGARVRPRLDPRPEDREHPRVVARHQPRGGAGGRAGTQGGQVAAVHQGQRQPVGRVEQQHQRVDRRQGALGVVGE
jgi:hypothetical protein